MIIIDSLPTISSPATGDELAIERGTVTYKIDYNALATAIINKLGDPVTITHGGTGATTAPAARTALGITPANIGAVAKTGDTMTGALYMQLQLAEDMDSITVGRYVVMRGDDTTLNTPYKAGLAGGATALIISCNWTANTGIQYWQQTSSTALFVRAKNGSLWDDWMIANTPDQRATYSMEVNVTGATIGKRCANQAFDLPSGVTRDNIKAIYISRNSSGQRANVVPAIDNNGQLTISVYAAETSVQSNIAVTVVY